jgi:uncharacterized membrane protein YwzB
MSEIRIGPTAQIAILVAVLAAVVAFLGLQAPEVRRYLKIRTM